MTFLKEFLQNHSDDIMLNLNKQFFFLSGLPRSGSTVLTAMLNQNPQIYATSTSPLLDFLYLTEQQWKENPSVVANPNQNQIMNVSEGIINGTWKHIKEPIIIDKHRAWARNSPILNSIFGHNKVIATVRDLPEIAASFLTLVRESPYSNIIDQKLSNSSIEVTDENRCDLILNEYVRDPWMSLKERYDSNVNNLLLLEYDEIVGYPLDTMNRIYEFLGLESYNDHEVNNVIHKEENDSDAWGIPNLHHVRSTIKRVSPSAETILGKDLYQKYSSLNYEFWR